MRERPGARQGDFFPFRANLRLRVRRLLLLDGQFAFVLLVVLRGWRHGVALVVELGLGRGRERRGHGAEVPEQQLDDSEVHDLTRRLAVRIFGDDVQAADVVARVAHELEVVHLLLALDRERRHRQTLGDALVVHRRRRIHRVAVGVQLGLGIFAFRRGRRWVLVGLVPRRVRIERLLRGLLGSLRLLVVDHEPHLRYVRRARPLERYIGNRHNGFLGLTEATFANLLLRPTIHLSH